MTPRFILAAAALCHSIAAGQAEPRLVKDINRVPQKTYPNISAVTPLGGQVLFAAADDSHGAELWVSDGSEKPPRLLKDIRRGREGALPMGIMTMGGKAYFPANDGVHGVELWCSDGTEQGTALVKDLIDYFDGYPTPVAASSGRLWFTGTGPGFGWFDEPSLWATDGTPEGTVELNPTIWDGISFPAWRAFDQVKHFAVLGDQLYFVANGREIWHSDGTVAGTVKVEQLPGDWDHEIESLVAAGDRWFALHHDGSDASPLWTGTGQAGSAVRVESSGWSAWGDLTVLGDKVFFAAMDDASQPGLWMSDGTGSGTSAVTGTVSVAGDDFPTKLFAAGNTLFFTRSAADGGEELWKSDGTPVGTSRVKKIRRDDEDPFLVNMTAAGNAVYFSADDGLHGPELWFSDGTPGGTRLVADLMQGPGGSLPNDLTFANGLLYFGVHGDPALDGLWMTDGTARRTRRLSGDETLNASGVTVSGASAAAAVGKRVFFNGTDGKHGLELWTSNGSPGGTRMIRDISPGKEDSSPAWLTRVGDRVVFSVDQKERGSEVWTSDGTRCGTRALTHFNADGGYPYQSNFIPMGDLCYFLSSGVSGNRLWQTDGAKQGTMEVPAANGAELAVAVGPGAICVAGGKLFLSANDGQSGFELWALNGGILSQVKDLQPGPAWAMPSHLTAVGNRLAFFTEVSGGLDLWSSDGTEAGTLKVTGRFNEVSYSTALGDLHLFLADDGEQGFEWWKSDGTSSGTTLLKDIVAGSGLDEIDGRNGFVPMGDGVMFFAANGADLGLELWKTDGTEVGTVLVKDLVPGSGGSDPRELVYAQGRLYFAASDDLHGRDLWSSDGTEAGTVRVTLEDQQQGTDANPIMLTPAGDRLFFGATRPGKGCELHVMDLPFGP